MYAVSFIVLINRSFKVLCLVEDFPAQIIFIFLVKIEIISIPDQLPSTSLFLTVHLALLVFLKDALTYCHVLGKLQDSEVTPGTVIPSKTWVCPMNFTAIFPIQFSPCIQWRNVIWLDLLGFRNNLRIYVFLGFPLGDSRNGIVNG